MEPKKDECFGTCSMFRNNPVLRQGDACRFYQIPENEHYFFLIAVLFDQRVWTYLGTSWTDVTYITVQLVSFSLNS